jgi:HD-like signal output (HDOD) protein
MNPLITEQDLARAMEELPVFPAVALEVLHELQSDEASLGGVERLASSDQVLAASLIRVANSALYGPCREATSLTNAIVRLGTEVASQVVIAASLKPLFASAALRDLWQHSTTAAGVCAQLAARGGAISTGEAVVLGLVHDIGRLIIQALPGGHAAAHARITKTSADFGAPDYLVCGRGHAELGAELLERWNFPAEFVEGVRYHHRPEAAESGLASMLYVSEYLTGFDEEMSSFSRLADALGKTDVPLSECLDLSQPPRRLTALFEAA